MDPVSTQLTVAEAARLARVDEQEIRDALVRGDLRNLGLPAVDSWARARVAGIVARAQRP